MKLRRVDVVLRIGIAFGLAVTTLTVGVPAATGAAPAVERRLTTSTSQQTWPEVSGKYVVFSDDRNERLVGDPNDPESLYDVRLLNLSTGRSRVLTPKHTAMGRAAISGNRVVWVDYGNGRNSGVWYHNLATGTHKRISSAGGVEVEISGRNVCYERSNRVWVYNLRTKKERAVSPKASSAASCDISGSVVVWQDFRNGNHDIYSYNLSTRKERRLTTDTGGQTIPKISGNRVVWTDDRNGGLDLDVYAFNLATWVETRLTTASGNQWFPNISGTRVVWMDERNGTDNTEVYAYDFATGTEARVTDHAGWSGNPVVSGTRVVWSDDRAGNLDLYLRTLG